MLCLLTDCSKKDAVVPESIKSITSIDEADGSASSASTQKVIPNGSNRKAFVELAFGARVNSFCLQGSGMCNINIVNEKIGITPGNGKFRALASASNGKFVLEFVGNHNHPQLNGSTFIMDANLVLPLSVSNAVGLQPGYTVSQGNYTITTGPGNKKIIVF